MAHQAVKIPKVFLFLLTLVAVIIILYIAKPLYILQEGQVAVITRFGEIIKTENVAGLKVKVPFIDSVRRYSKKVLSWDGAPRRVPTLEKQFIWVDTTARWRITDPKKFYQSVNFMSQAFSRLDDIIESAVRTVIAQNELVEAVRNSNNITKERKPAADPIDTENADVTETDETGFDELDDLLTQLEVQPTIKKGRRQLSNEMLVAVKRVVPEFGLEVIDVVIRQIRYSDDLTESVYNRMVSERKQIAQVYRSRGEGRKQKWFGQLDNEKRSILSRAYAEAESIKGDADASAAQTYSASYGRSPSFFNFWRAMESYKKTVPNIDKVLSTDGDYFRYFYNSSGN